MDGAQRKALALLAVLASSGSSGVGRDRLMALLWPESDLERARGALKQTTHVLRQLLGSTDAVLGSAELRLNPEIVTSDVAAFRDALAEGDAEGALRHYAGPFLDGVYVDSAGEFERWAEEMRGDLARRRLEAMEQLAVQSAERGDHAAAARWWRSVAAVDPLSGRVALNLMRAFEASGNRAAALRHARVHAELLKQELGAVPDADVAALAERLTRDPVPVASQPPPREQLNAPDVRLADGRGLDPLPRRGSQRLRYAFGGAAIIVATLLLVAFYNWRQTTARAASLDPNRVAVGVFENQTGDSTLEPLGRMAADWIVRGLARTGTTHVLDIGTLYARPSAGSHEGALDLARRNGAGLAVAGRFFRERGDSLLFTAAVYEVGSNRVLHTLDPVRTTPNEALPAVEELKERLAATLAAISDPRAPTYLRGPIGRPPTYDAYREFVRANELYWRGRTGEAVAGYRRAAALDSTFLAAYMWLITSSVTMDNCAVIDSVLHELERRKVQLDAANMLNIRGHRTRCNRDWNQGVMDQRERLAVEPWSTLPRWSVSAQLRRANRPAEAVAALRAIDPARDLGWMADDGKVMYWRELAWAQHMLGDVAGQQEALGGLRRFAPGRLAIAYFAALERVSAGKPNEAVEALRDVEALAADPAIAIGEIAGRLSPERVSTPAWVLYQVGVELLSVGDSAGAVALAQRAVRWLETRSGAEQMQLEHRYQRVLALELQGQLDSASALVRRLLEDYPASIEIHGRSGILAARRGDRQAAMTVDAWLAARTGVQPPGLPQLERARIAAVLGERERAMQLLETLPFRAHPVDVVFFHSDPAFAPLRSDERWIRMLKPLG